MHARSGLLVACLAALILAGDAFTPANVSFALHRRNAIGWGLSGTPIDGSCGTHLKECYGECVPLDWKTCGTLCMPPRWDCCNNGWCCRTKCVGGDSCDGTDQCAGQVPGCCFEALTDIGNCGSNKFTCPQPENGWGYCDRGTCQVECRTGYRNVDGVCRKLTCSIGLTNCFPGDYDLDCKDLKTDNQNCGSCGTACGVNERCESGYCRSTIVITTAARIPEPVPTTRIPDPVIPTTSRPAPPPDTTTPPPTTAADSTTVSSFAAKPTAIPLTSGSIVRLSSGSVVFVRTGSSGLSCRPTGCVVDSTASGEYSIVTVPSLPDAFLLRSVTNINSCIVAAGGSVIQGSCPSSLSRRQGATVMPYWALFKGTNGNRIVNVHLDSSSGCLLAPSISVGLGDCSSSFAEKWTVSTDAEVAGGSSGGTNLAPIIGGAVGGAVGLALLIGLGVYLNRRKSKSQASHELESMPKAANAPTGNPSPYHSSASAQLAPNPLMPENASAAPYYGSAQWTAPFVSENPKTNPPAYSGSRNPGLPIAPVSRQISNQQFYSHGGDEFDLAAQAFSSDSQASRFTGTTVSPTVGRSLGDSGIPWNNREPTLLNSENSTTSKSTLLPVSKILIAASDVTYDLNAGLLGRGSFGTVYRGVFRGNLPVAVKVLNVATDTEVFDAFRREVATWEGLNHDNVLGLQGFCISPPMMIMKLVNGGNMREFLDRKNWDQALGRQLLQDISEGMNYLHVMNVLHGDLKSENVMVDVKPNGNITGKITDFGMSRFRPDPNRNSTNHQPGGTLPFMAPELFDNKRLERPADVYAFAMTCYEVVTYGRYPRQGYSQFDIIRGKRPAIPPETPRRLQSLIERCWAHEPETRPTFAAVVNEMTAIVALD